MDKSSELISSTRVDRPLRVSVEGNIGSGKTTFLNYCQHRRNDVDVAFEPVSQWTNLNGTNLLSNFYGDPGKWAMPFQSYVSLTMLELWSRRSDKEICLTERSLLSSRYCFLEAMRSSGTLDPAMYSILVQWHAFYVSKFDFVTPHAIVYLETTPTVAHRRMLSRSRTEESSVPLAYLEQLDALHGIWLRREQTANIPIFVIDADQPMDTLIKSYDECLGNLKLLRL
ncbi:deoxynucleoside kinase-like [Bradysia coprophila]|uniref:deoxynucleoside kinase-like n=1 Tax=Bradysia coprophila TaxID=38358 RepID=UPI00187D6EDD|nr:deoxynucleoside kinase-like [Bradysia coprophila]